MKANETKVNEFLAKNKIAFTIPVYQRNYDWTLFQCKQLLDDIFEAGQDEQINAHFIGSIVYVHDGIYSASGLIELTIIDGQQRLTTITLIYIALYQLAKKMQTELFEQSAIEISETYLINKFLPEEQKIKLKLTENNKAALQHILNSFDGETFKNYSRIIENFTYFKSVININNFEVVQRGLSKLMFVDIALDRQNDNPQRIFESLNSTGLELSQADLIRNYILMGLSSVEQERIYKQYWQVIEKYATDEMTNQTKISEFIRDYLTLKNKEIPNKDKVYIEFKKKNPTSKIEQLECVLRELKSLVKYYNKLLNSKNESDKQIRIQLEYINKLEINVAFPFLMKVYEDFATQTIDKNTFILVLSTVQSFVFRRFMVGLPTNALNKIFMGLYDKVEPNHYLFSIQESLLQKSGVYRFPRNIETINAFKEKDVYNIKLKNRTYLFERLENFQNNEPVIIEGNADITIEHIFPQNPDPQWKIELGTEEYNLIKDYHLNTIGNLTFSGNNGKLSNKPFLDKKEMNIDGKEQGYNFSRLWLNRDLKDKTKWDISAIAERINIIAERFINIWSIPDINIQPEEKNDEINIFDAKDPKHKKLEYAIFFDKKIVVTQVAKLYIEVFKTLFSLEPEAFFISDIGNRLNLTKTPDIDGLRQAVPINETYFIESNMDNVGKFEKIKYALSTLGFEDKLMIKYEN
ncbi:MAG: hypothetical protein RI956_558 [Pseudomonadota bacterium]|jgi:uncharacterized protein with ParB-like and HNH nuclease domain